MARTHILRTTAVLAAATTIAVTGCTKSAEEASGGSGGAATSEEASQVIERTSSETCTNPSPSDMQLSEMKVGFSQSENEQNPFRATETESVRAAVEENAQELVYTNANSDQAKQLSDIRSMINQGVDALIVAPISATGLQSAFDAANEAGIPVVTIDRQTEGTPCEDYLTFLGSDFREQGVRAAEAMVEAIDGEGRIAEIQGAPGSDVATLRTEGFESVISENPDMQIVAQQPGNWSTSEAQQVMSQLLISNPDINGVYTHSDTMALGALTAIQNSGKTAGEDIQVVSIDGTRDAVSRVAEGEIHAVVETNPRFGPAAIQMLEDWFAGEEVPQEVIMKDSLYTEDNAQEALDSGKAY
ncbi:substrate-binding domain-containing protein [Kocuria sediminis]|uniref:Substrate-binding domain-containing protein n=1 Tax=Kocuria sediminis TaxID=1038857 RepID=A0A6N8GKX1_9MICC|nr:ABC transporter substrate-binding protein [Kocuria sediminis]MUN62900.1 substrate-binding domain-containing protein [Kocuria sediminis]